MLLYFCCSKFLLKRGHFWSLAKDMARSQYSSIIKKSGQNSVLAACCCCFLSLGKKEQKKAVGEKGTRKTGFVCSSSSCRRNFYIEIFEPSKPRSPPLTIAIFGHKILSGLLFLFLSLCFASKRVRFEAGLLIEGGRSEISRRGRDRSY